MKIAHIVADGRPGGGSTFVLGLIEDTASSAGHAVTLVSQPRSYLEEQACRRGIDFVGCNLFTGWFDPTPPWRLRRALRTRRFDLTHLHGLRAAHHAVRWPLRPCLGRLVYTIHGLHQLHATPLVRALANAAERQVMRRVDAPVFVSNADLDAARGWSLLPGNDTAGVIWNGIDIEAVAKHQRAQRSLDVIFIGRLVEQKQPLLAARVLAALAAKGWRCAMVGGGPLEQACRAQLSALPGGRAVRMLGEMAQPAGLDVLAESRVLIMPSAWEGLPILPMEAMALGVAVVASDVPGVAEVLGADTGILVASNDAVGFERAAESVLVRGDVERALRTAAAERAGDCFRRSRSSAAYLALYDRLLGAARSTARGAEDA